MGGGGWSPFRPDATSKATATPTATPATAPMTAMCFPDPPEPSFWGRAAAVVRVLVLRRAVEVREGGRDGGALAAGAWPVSFRRSSSRCS
ncbi:MAG: hypothetical protein ACYS9X_28800, partial [Planctomycetota bacterium]